MTCDEVSVKCTAERGQGHLKANGHLFPAAIASVCGCARTRARVFVVGEGGAGLGQDLFRAASFFFLFFSFFFLFLFLFSFSRVISAGALGARPGALGRPRCRHGEPHGVRLELRLRTLSQLSLLCFGAPSGPQLTCRAPITSASREEASLVRPTVPYP